MIGRIAAVLMGAGALALVLARPAIADDAPGHQKVRFVVAARDLAFGEVLLPADLEEREFEQRWISSSVVDADSRATIEHQPIRFPLRRGDLLRWTVFDLPEPATLELREKCMRATAAPTTGAEQVEQARQRILRR